MDKRAKIILFAVVAAFVLIIVVKPFLKGSNTSGGAIDTNPDYAQSIASAKAAGQPVFLEFYGENWPACVTMSPVVQALAQKYGKEIRFIVADISTSYGLTLANDYQIQVIPTMFFIDKSGKVVDTYAGTLTSDELEDKLKNLVK